MIARARRARRTNAREARARACGPSLRTGRLRNYWREVAELLEGLESLPRVAGQGGCGTTGGLGVVAASGRTGRLRNYWRALMLSGAGRASRSIADRPPSPGTHPPPAPSPLHPPPLASPPCRWGAHLISRGAGASWGVSPTHSPQPPALSPWFQGAAAPGRLWTAVRRRRHRPPRVGAHRSGGPPGTRPPGPARRSGARSPFARQGARLRGSDAARPRRRLRFRCRR